MIKRLSVVAAALMALSLIGGSAEAWDNCGHGFHRNYWGTCVSNYGPTSSCPPGYHLGWNVRRCHPNW